MLEIVYRAAGNARSPQGSDRFSHRLLGEEGVEDLLQFQAVVHPVFVDGELGVFLDLRKPHRVAEPAPEAVVAHAEIEVAILALVCLIRRDGGMLVPPPGRKLSGSEVVVRVVGEQGHLPVEHADVDHLAHARFLAVVQREQNPLCGEHSRRDVPNGCAKLAGRAVGLSGDAHDPALALNDHVEAGLALPGAGLAESRERGEYHRRVDAVDLLPGKPELVQRAGPEVLHDDVALANQIAQKLLAALVLQVERETFLVAVNRDEVRANPVQKGWPPAPGVVPALGMFDLDDLRAHIAQHHGAIRACENSRQVDYANAFEWSSHESVAPSGLDE